MPPAIRGITILGEIIMKIDVNAFLDSLPIMGVGLLGIFIVTIVIIIGIYILTAITSKSAEADNSGATNSAANETNPDKNKKSSANKESAMDLLKEKEKKDFLETDDTYEIFEDL